MISIVLDFFRYCWFADDVTATMLIDRNMSVSLRWELNAFYCKFREKKCIGLFQKYHNTLCCPSKLFRN